MMPGLMYGTWQLWQQRTRTFVIKRSSFIAFGLNISLIYAIFATCMVQYTMLFCEGDNCARIESISFVTGLWLLFYFLNCKNFLIFFRYKWTHSIHQLKWQQLINPTDDKKTHETNWFIQHHHTFGNNRFVYKLFSILHLIGFTLHCASFLVTSNVLIASILGICSLLPPILFYPIIVAKTPSFNDMFFVHWESKIHSRILLLILVELIIIATIISSAHFNIRIGGIVGGLLMSSSFVAMGVVSTFLITKKYDKSREHDKSTIDRKQTLKTILSNEDSIHLFMLHLSKELIGSFLSLSFFVYFVLLRDHNKCLYIF